MPLSVTGLSSESIVIVNGIFVTLDAPDGLRWDSGWKSPGIFLFPEQKNTRFSFNLKRKFFERVQSSQVRLRLYVAFTLFRDKDRRQFVVPRGEFALPNAGLCSVQAAYVPNIQCLGPLRRPSFLLMTTDMSANTCPLRKGESPANPGEIARGWSQNGESDPAEFGISPVTSFSLYLSNWNGSSNRRLGDCGDRPRPQESKRSAWLARVVGSVRSRRTRRTGAQQRRGQGQRDPHPGRHHRSFSAAPRRSSATR